MQAYSLAFPYAPGTAWIRLNFGMSVPLTTNFGACHFSSATVSFSSQFLSVMMAFWQQFHRVRRMYPNLIFKLKFKNHQNCRGSNSKLLLILKKKKKILQPGKFRPDRLPPPLNFSHFLLQGSGKSRNFSRSARTCAWLPARLWKPAPSANGTRRPNPTAPRGLIN